MSANAANDGASGPTVDAGRRHFLLVATSSLGLAGVVATAVPFIQSWRPSAQAKAAGQPVEADIGKLEPGAMMKVEWRGQAVFIVHRTPEMIASIGKNDGELLDPNSEKSDLAEQPKFTRTPARALKPEYLVLVGVCTHLGCAPMSKFEQGTDPELGANWGGGFFCPCHGSKFDMSGRVYKNVPAGENLKVPPYQFLSDNKLLIGSEAGAA